MTHGRRGNPGCGLASHLGGHSCPFRGVQQQAPGAEGTVRRRRHFAGEGGVGHGLGPRACLSCGSFSSLILTSSHQARRRGLVQVRGRRGGRLAPVISDDKGASEKSRSSATNSGGSGRTTSLQVSEDIPNCERCAKPEPRLPARCRLVLSEDFEGHQKEPPECLR